MEHVFGGLLKVFVAGEFREWDLLREKVYLEDVSFRHGIFEVALPAAVVLEGRAYIPTNLAVFTKGSARFR
jgi:hypothetical protein